MEFDRRRFLLGALVLAGGGAFGSWLSGCAPEATIEDARGALMGLWDAVVPGTWNGIVEDPKPGGGAFPGATDAGVQEWLEATAGALPGGLSYLSDWFLRAWAADLNLWARAFHLLDQPPGGFADLPLGPTLNESGREEKIVIMEGLFEHFIDVLNLKYFGATVLAKAAFYGDFRAETTGTAPVGGPYIGFDGANGPGPIEGFTYNRPFGTGDSRLGSTPGGLVMVP